MGYLAMEELLKNAKESMYKLVIMASRRAVELGSGSEKLVDAEPNTKLTSIALEEIRENKISYTTKNTTKKK